MSQAVSRSGRPDRSGGHRLLSIGEVLAELQPDFSDLTHSKLRFLEDRGLVEPDRTPAGYRKFTTADVERLRLVLMLQRDRFMPLKAIGEYLDALDRGLEPPELPGGAPRAPRAAADAGAGGPERFVSDQRRLRLRRAELLDAADLEDSTSGEDLLASLEAFGMVSADSSGYFDADDLDVVRTAGGLAAFGIEARHLRAFRTAADRELGLVEQVVTPLRRQRGPGSPARADEVAREISSLCVRLHAGLVRSGLSRRGG